jgi:hypothetical protein
VGAQEVWSSSGRFAGWIKGKMGFHYWYKQVIKQKHLHHNPLHDQFLYNCLHNKSAPIKRLNSAKGVVGDGRIEVLYYVSSGSPRAFLMDPVIHELVPRGIGVAYWAMTLTSRKSFMGRR